MTDVEIMARKFSSLVGRLEKRHCSYKKAVEIVGGEKRLQDLMDNERVRYEKPLGAKNTMWRFNMADIINNVKPVPSRFPKAASDYE